MSLRYSAIQSVRCGEEGEEPEERPQFLELVHAHEAWGAKMRVDLIWRPLARPAPPPAARVTHQRAAGRATPPPRPRAEEGDEELVTIIQAAPMTSKEALFRKLKQSARRLMEMDETCWSSKEGPNYFFGLF